MQFSTQNACKSRTMRSLRSENNNVFLIVRFLNKPFLTWRADSGQQTQTMTLSLRLRALKPNLNRFFFHLEQYFSLTNSSSILPNHPNSSRISPSEQIFWYNTRSVVSKRSDTARFYMHETTQMHLVKAYGLNLVFFLEFIEPGFQRLDSLV